MPSERQPYTALHDETMERKAIDEARKRVAIRRWVVDDQNKEDREKNRNDSTANGSNVSTSWPSRQQRGSVLSEEYGSRSGSSNPQGTQPISRGGLKPKFARAGRHLLKELVGIGTDHLSEHESKDSDDTTQQESAQSRFNSFRQSLSTGGSLGNSFQSSRR